MDSSSIPPVRLPPPVGPGDRVGVAALSGPAEPELVDAGLAALERLGFTPVPAANLRRRNGMFAGDDAARLAAFHELAADPDLRAVFFLRGGWGALRLLPAIDWELLARHPRAYVGYSDLTPLLLEMVRRLGLVTFHGPMVAADLARGLDATEETSFLDALAGRYPREVPVEELPDAGDAGPVTGPLLGGCLSLLTATLGTPFAPRLAGSLLFVEDVGEPLYRIDRMLTHLRLSGNLTHVRAMILAQLRGPDAAPHDRGALTALVRDGFARADLVPRRLPLAAGLAAGHGAPNLTLPLGLPARLEPAAGRLVLGAEAA